MFTVVPDGEHHPLAQRGEGVGRLARAGGGGDEVLSQESQQHAKDEKVQVEQRVVLEAQHDRTRDAIRAASVVVVRADVAAPPPEGVF